VLTCGHRSWRGVRGSSESASKRSACEPPASAPELTYDNALRCADARDREDQGARRTPGRGARESRGPAGGFGGGGTVDRRTRGSREREGQGAGDAAGAGVSDEKPFTGARLREDRDEQASH